MKVLIATPSLLKEVGGPAYSVSMIDHHLRLAGVDTVTVTRSAEGGSSLPLFAHEELLDKVELIHNFGTWTPFNHRIASAARRANIPCVFCPMGMLEPWSLAQKRLKKQIGLKLYQRDDINRSAAVHATSRLEAENLRAIGIDVPIAVIPHGIDFPVNQPVKQSHDPNSDEKTILFMSRIHPKKGLLELVDACARMKRGNWKVIIAGPDTDGYQTVIEQAVGSAKLQDKFAFVGPVYGEQKSDLFTQADLFVLPTHSENFGLVIPEALAHGVPVITTTGAPWAEIQEVNCGWWIPPGADPLEVALTEALSMSRATLIQMGERGRSLVEARYAWPAIIQKHIVLYKWLISGGQRPDFLF